MTACRIGRTYARVLPVPVSSRRTASEPERRTGQERRWMSVGSSMPISYSPASRCGLRPSASNPAVPPMSSCAAVAKKREPRGGTTGRPTAIRRTARAPGTATEYPRTSGSTASIDVARRITGRPGVEPPK
eukprot:scaffold12921_cov87-Isochrysis_galbana.AAC.2